MHIAIHSRRGCIHMEQVRPEVAGCRSNVDRIAAELANWPLEVTSLLLESPSCVLDERGCACALELLPAKTRSRRFRSQERSSWPDSQELFNR